MTDELDWNAYLKSIKKLSLKTRFVDLTRAEPPRIVADFRNQFNENHSFLPRNMIDLHGMTEDQAYQNLTNFIVKNYQDELRTITVVTGKGLGNQGALRRLLPMWLEHPKFTKYIRSFIAVRDRADEIGSFTIYLKKHETKI